MGEVIYAQFGKGAKVLQIAKPAPVVPESLPADEMLRRCQRTQKPATFEVGVTYGGRFICDHGSIFEYTVIRRTDKSVWLRSGSGGEIERFKIHRSEIMLHGKKVFEYEFVYPHGRYSMASILTAEKRR